MDFSAQSNAFLDQLVAGFLTFFTFLLLAVIILAFGYMLIQWLKHHRREKYALGFVTLMIKLPKDNEIKIDAAEQMFAGLYSLKNSALRHQF